MVFIFIRLKIKNFKIPIIIYGNGIQRDLLLQKISASSDLEWNPVAIIDDYSEYQSINGIKIIKSNQMESTLKQLSPMIMVITDSKVSALTLQNIQNICTSLNIEMRIIPPSFEITGKEFNIEDIRLPSLEELIGKSAISVDLNILRKIYADQTIIITGAGGSIGSEIARQLTIFNPEKVFFLDRDESALLELQLSLNKTEIFNQTNLILADIRDSERISQIFARIKPSIVIHAAALKHLQMLEEHPDEAFKTNILGTRNILIESLKHKVKIFINISTDKASEPTSILGKSKYITERLTTKIGLESDVENSQYLSVRFGNVFGSRGSVLFTFQNQIKNGGPITITCPGIKRYFMTIQEAVHLALRAPKYGVTGQTLVLKMGEPIEIEFIAKKLIELSNKNIEIRFGALRNGEKLIETLIGKDEKIIDSSDHSIIVVKSESLQTEITQSNWEGFINTNQI